jgi:hypothetical protein
MPAASKRSGSPFSLRPEWFRGALYGFAALCKACERESGQRAGFCGTALDVHVATGILSFTE